MSMLSITSKSANQAWIETFRQLVDQGDVTGNDKYYRDEVALIAVTDPQLEAADTRFPMAQRDIDIINQFIVSGAGENAVGHAWTKLYYHRMFDEPDSQIKFLLRTLSATNPVGETQISLWDKSIDQSASIQPCVQIVWARIKQGRLELHVHTSSSDCYKKLLMNMLEFISLQQYIAKEASLPAGTFYFFIDSCHLYFKDLADIRDLRNHI